LALSNLRVREGDAGFGKGKIPEKEPQKTGLARGCGCDGTAKLKL